MILGDVTKHLDVNIDKSSEDFLLYTNHFPKCSVTPSKTTSVVEQRFSTPRTLHLMVKNALGWMILHTNCTNILFRIKKWL